MEEFLLLDDQNLSGETKTPARPVLRTAAGFDVLSAAFHGPNPHSRREHSENPSKHQHSLGFPQGDISAD